MGLEDDLTPIFIDQQLLMLKIQELDNKLTKKLALDAEWGMAVDRKLQTILDVLGHSVQVGPSQTVNSGPYYRQYLITTQLRRLLMICRYW